MTADRAPARAIAAVRSVGTQVEVRVSAATLATSSLELTAVTTPALDTGSKNGLSTSSGAKRHSSSRPVGSPNESGSNEATRGARSCGGAMVTQPLLPFEVR
ncbi:unannotated protein [freshwater metagenome]|uniref:Unannotated protein n=1 Tax=freshwater metagenome TaxID=449393 RepID=A0A6J7D4E5_9ZZZZ